MKKEVIIEKLRQIFTNSELEDLEFDDVSEIRFKDYVPEDDMQIGMFFFHNNQLYLGALAGPPNYVSLGSIEQLNDIFYRPFPNDGILDIIFDFGDYRLSCCHVEYRNEVIGIYNCKQEEWVLYESSMEKSTTIQETIDKIMNTNA